MDLTPFIKKNDTKPIYFQVYHFFREEIEQRNLKAGEKLPSIRQLSSHLNISRNTVETAYQQLLSEGYVESREKSGLYVLELEELISVEKDTVTQFKKDPLKNEGKKNNIDFQYGDIELDRFPLKTWKKCIVDAMEIPNQEVFSYGDKKGHAGLRREIAAYLYQARGVRCSSNQIILSAGTQHAIHLITQILNLPNEKVAMENPGYDGVRAVFKNHHCQIAPIPLESDGIHLSELEKSKAKCVYVTPSHQFPLGMVLPIQKRLKLLQWAEKFQSYIIEDDYDGEFRYQGQPIPSLKSLDKRDTVIYLGTFSKAFLPAARVSYIVLPNKLLERFQSQFFFYNQAVSPLIQEALYRFMKEGHFSRHIRKMRKIYQGKQQALINSIDLHLETQAKIIGQKAGLHLLLEFSNLDARELVVKAETLGVKVYLTDKYWEGHAPQANQPIILGFGGLSERIIDEGIQKLAKVVNSFK